MEQAISLDPRSVLMLQNLAGSYAALRKYKNVEAIITKTENLDSETAKITYGIRSVYLATGDALQAIEFLNNNNNRKKKTRRKK